MKVSDLAVKLNQITRTNEHGLNGRSKSSESIDQLLSQAICIATEYSVLKTGVGDICVSNL